MPARFHRLGAEFPVQLRTAVSRFAIAASSHPYLRFPQGEPPAIFAPACTRCVEPRHGTFADQIVLELRQRGEDPEHEAARAGSGVNPRALAGGYTQAHAASGQVLNGIDEMGEVRPRNTGLSGRNRADILRVAATMAAGTPAFKPVPPQARLVSAPE